MRKTTGFSDVDGSTRANDLVDYLAVLADRLAGAEAEVTDIAFELRAADNLTFTLSADLTVFKAGDVLETAATGPISCATPTAICAVGDPCADEPPAVQHLYLPIASL